MTPVLPPVTKLISKLKKNKNMEDARDGTAVKRTYCAGRRTRVQIPTPL